MAPVTVNTGSPEISIVAIRPFMHNGQTVAIGQVVSIAKSDGNHIVACGKAVLDSPEARKQAEGAKADAEAKAKALEASLAPKGGAGVDVKALTASITKAVSDDLGKKLDDHVAKLAEGMASEVKKQVEEALAKKK